MLAKYPGRRPCFLLEAMIAIDICTASYRSVISYAHMHKFSTPTCKESILVYALSMHAYYIRAYATLKVAIHKEILLPVKGSNNFSHIV